MIVRPYTDDDFPEIAEWGRRWGAKYSADQFPKVGFIVPGLAAYFLYQTDSTICFMENLISNREADPKQRAQAVDLVTMAIISSAQMLGYRVAYATTDVATVVVRALAQGAQARSKQTLLIKNLAHS